MKVELNIGMEGCPTDWIGISRDLAYNYHQITLKETHLVKGEYEGKPEETLYAILDIDEEDIVRVLEFIQFLTVAYNQECIAVITKGYRGLIYQMYYEGERLEFDDKLFKTK